MRSLTTKLRLTGHLSGLMLLMLTSNSTLAGKPDHWEPVAQDGEGFLVWESNRSGRWRIWTRNLDGSGLKQLSEDEKDTRDHFCPHISPDGNQILYLSFPETTVYRDPAADQKIQLRITTPDGKHERELLGDVIHGALGNRAAVWIDSDRFSYLGRDGRARIYSITTGMSTGPMTASQNRYLLDPTLRYACDRFHFHPYDRRSKTVNTSGQTLGGCEPYFTHDGRWGIRMSGAGGPITRVDMATSQVHTLLNKNDARMPRDRAYVYFPMISRCNRLFAFGASPNQHDHFHSDYDIFVTRVDPLTLAFQGHPVRYTFDGKTDRYPDIHMGEPTLGTHRGEAPLRVTFPAASLSGRDSSWKWDYGNGTQGRTPECLYTSPGRYSVNARKRSKQLFATVDVRPAKPPHVTSSSLKNARTVILRFDEPVDDSTMDATYSTGTRMASSRVSQDGRTVSIEMASALSQAGTLTVSGVKDRAQVPNTMPDTSVAIAVLRWPANVDACVWAWQTAAKNALPDRIAGKIATLGSARYTHARAMDTYMGSFSVKDADDILANTFKKASAFSIELTLSTDQNQTQSAGIISVSTQTNEICFAIGQKNAELILHARQTQERAPVDIPLTPIAMGEPTHVTLIFESGQVSTYRNGKHVHTAKNAFIDFVNGEPLQLIIGKHWDGIVEGLAIYNAALSDEDVQKSYSAYRALRAERSPIKQWQGKARLVARSDTPTLAQITPYDEALAMYEFVMLESDSPDYPAGTRFRAATWVWLNRTACALVKTPLQTELSVRVTRKDDNPQLKSIFLSDTLDFDPDMQEHYLVRP